MKEKLNNLYVVFPIGGIVFIILNALGLQIRRYGHYTIIECLEKYDITGLTTIFYIVFTVINLIVLIYCCYKGKQGLEKGWDYSLSKKLSIIFIILAMISILCFIGIRGEEESLAMQLDEDIVDIFERDKYTITTSTKNKKNNKTNINENLKKDPFYSRKLEIRKEIQNDPSTIYRYITKFIYIPTSRYITREEAYYLIFFNFTFINIIMRRILFYTYW